jgi:hypothetical protein
MTKPSIIDEDAMQVHPEVVPMLGNLSIQLHQNLLVRVRVMRSHPGNPKSIKRDITISNLHSRFNMRLSME